MPRVDALADQGIPTGWNREHSWPRSLGLGHSGPDFSDLHALFAADWNVNSARSNRYFDDCHAAECVTPAHAEAAVDTARNALSFMPPASQRGDLARAMFYMAMRYDGTEPLTIDLELAEMPNATAGIMARLSTLLRWHADDPVSHEERLRNERICRSWQHNRNPFIDHPEFVPCVFAADCTPSPGPPPHPPYSPPRPSPPPCSPRPPSPPPSPPVMPLAAGDCAIVGFRASNPDDVAVLMLAPVEAGTELKLTDAAALADGSLASTEGVRSYHVPATLAAGSVLRLDHFDDVESGALSLSVAGDQAIVYVGTRAAPTFLCAFSAAGPWDEATISTTRSALPRGLTDGLDALALPRSASATQYANYAYAGPTVGTATDLRSAIHGSASWYAEAVSMAVSLTAIPLNARSHAVPLKIRRCSLDPYAPPHPHRRGLSTSPIHASHMLRMHLSSDPYAHSHKLGGRLHVSREGDSIGQLAFPTTFTILPNTPSTNRTCQGRRLAEEFAPCSRASPPPPMPPTPPTSPTPPIHSSTSEHIAIAPVWVVIGSVVLAMLIIGFVTLWCSRQRSGPAPLVKHMLSRGRLTGIQTMRRSDPRSNGVQLKEHHAKVWTHL